MIFRDPVFLILALGPAVYLFKRMTRKTDRASVIFPSQILISGLERSWRVQLLEKLPVLRCITGLLIVLALMRPQAASEHAPLHKEGIDIVLALDTSTSMLGEDFKIKGRRLNRVDVVKDVVADFVRARPDDRISFVVFAGDAFTVSPLTLDHDWLLKNLSRIQGGMLVDGTAIGTALAVSEKRLEDSKSKSKIIILLTDGRNNAGKMSPDAAAQAAKALGIRIDTIGVGSKGLIPYPFQDVFGRTVYRHITLDLDENLLRDIAQTTGGRYFRATDTESLRKVYQEIDRMEKVPFEEQGYRPYKELFAYFLIPALVLFLLEVILRSLVLRTIP